MSNNNFQDELRIVSLLEFSEALERNGRFADAAEHLCSAARILIEEMSNPAKAQRCLLRAKGLAPQSLTAQNLLNKYFPSLKTVSRPPVVGDTFSFPDDLDGGSGSGALSMPSPPLPSLSETRNDDNDE